MRSLALAGLFSALAAFSALAQTAPAPAQPAAVCIHPYDQSTGSIDHTKVVDATTILFFMKNGKIWKNVLKAPCRGLLLHGFAFVGFSDEICSNAQAIEVLQTHESCQLGAFTLYTPPAAH